MADSPDMARDLLAENEELRARLSEAEQTIEAIRNGEVDAVVISGPLGEQVYTLAGAETTYRLLVEDMNEGALVLSADGLIIYSNHNFARLLGMDASDVLGHNIYEFVAPSDAELLKQTLMKALSTSSKAEMNFVSAEGYEVPTFVSTGKLSSDGESHVSAVVTDLTQHKATEAELTTYREHLEDMVTQRTQELLSANEALTESEERFRSVLDNSLDCIYRFNMRTREYEYISPSCESTIGFSRCELNSHIGELALGEIHQDDLLALREALSRLDGVGQADLLYRQRHRTGEYRWISNHMHQANDELGRPLYRSGNIRDVTESKRAEEALRESEEKYRLIVEHSPSAIFEIDFRTLRLTTFNEGTCELLGFSEDELLDMDPASLLDEPSRELFMSRLKQAQNGSEPSTRVEYRIRRKDGEYRWGLLDLKYKYEDGAIVGAFVVGQDITERKQWEERLAEAQAEAERRAAQIESFFSNMTDGAVLVDAAGNLVLANDAAIRIWGQDVAATLEERMTQYPVCRPDGSVVAIDETATARALRGEVIRDGRYRIRREDGEIILSVSAGPIRSSNGSIIGATTVFRDVTDQVNYETRRDELLTREKNITNVLQQTVIPADVPHKMLCCEFGTIYRAALPEADIGGDFYDVFQLGQDCIAVLIGDVAGKGLAAANRVAAARYAIRCYAYIDYSPSRIMTLANEALCYGSDDSLHMLTAFLAIVDSSTGEMVYSNAGHEQPVVCYADGLCEELEIHSLPLGMMPGVKYIESSRKLSVGDFFVAVTDGITEARDKTGRLWGKSKLLEYLQDKRGKSPREIATDLLDAALAHAGGRLQDDAAVVSFRLGNDVTAPE